MDLLKYTARGKQRRAERYKGKRVRHPIAQMCDEPIKKGTIYYDNFLDLFFKVTENTRKHYYVVSADEIFPDEIGKRKIYNLPK